MYIRLFSRKPLGSQRVNRSQKLLKSAIQHFYSTFPSFRAKLSWNTSLIIRSKILRLLVIALTSDDKYCGHNRENLEQPIQMQLSEKTKKNSFFKIFILHFISNSISFELIAVNSPYYNENTCYRQPTCYKASKDVTSDK